MTNGIRSECAGAVSGIDLDAICANWRLVNGMVGDGDCAAVVKADANGLGATRVALALARTGCRHFFVAHVDEAIVLRPHLPAAARVYVLHGSPVGVEPEFVAHDLVPVLNGLEQVDAWSSLARRMGRALAAILQIDTGMSCLGLAPSEVEKLRVDPGRLTGVDLVYLMSHLACAEAQEDPTNAMQLENFRAGLTRFSSLRGTFANSSGIFLGRADHFALALPGAALYGLAPVAGAANPMRPVVALRGKVIQAPQVEPEAGVGYACRDAPSARLGSPRSPTAICAASATEGMRAPMATGCRRPARYPWTRSRWMSPTCALRAARRQPSGRRTDISLDGLTAARYRRDFDGKRAIVSEGEGK